jgi:hypothetical protein
MMATTLEVPVSAGTSPEMHIAGDTLTVTFRTFDMDAYPVFIRTKKLPESQVAYDWETDTYTVTTAALFAPMLGAEVPRVGVAYEPDKHLSEHLFDYQRWAVKLALDAKRFAIWADTGLGKTAMYLEWAKQVLSICNLRERATVPEHETWPHSGYEHIYPRVLIIAPLAVHQQIVAEHRKFHEMTYGEHSWWYKEPLILKTRDELVTWCAGKWPEPNARPGVTGAAFYQDHHLIAIVNYEKFIAGQIPELRHLAGIVADESSILRTGGGTIKWNLIKSARGVEYKLSCTATPAPNEAMEYASQAAFLEKLRNEGEILWTFFQRDKYGTWFIKPHAKDAFYRFMASWSLYMRDPAAFGFGDILSSLPDPVTHEVRVPLTEDQRERMLEFAVSTGKGLFADQKLGVKERVKFAQLARGFLYRGAGKDREVELVDSIKPENVATIAWDELRAGRRVLIWTTFDAEGEIIANMLGWDAEAGSLTAVLTGSQSAEERQAILDRFRAGDIRILISKPSLIGYGLNLQFVTSMIFSGIDDSMERRYQAIRRAYRFGQTEPVHVWTVYIPELEGVMFENVGQKERCFLDEVAAQERHYRKALGMDGER